MPMIAITLLVLSSAVDSVPQALQKMIEARQSLMTGRVEWVRELYADPVNPRTDHFVSRFAANQRLLESKAAPIDADDYIRKPDGSPVLDEHGGKFYPGPSPWMVMSAPGEVWQRNVREQGNQLFEVSIDFAEVQIPDPRAFGCGHSNSGSLEYAALGEFTEQERHPLRFQAARDGGNWMVIAEYETGARVWWIDSERGWNPVRMQVRDESDAIQFDIHSELQQIDGVWFPVRVTTYVGDAANKQVYESVRVEKAEFNKPDDPLVFGPSDIGIKFGAPVEKVSERRTVIDKQVFDGLRAVPREEFITRRNRGEFEAVQPEARAAPSAAPKGQAALERKLSEWEQFTLDFGQRHRFDQAQANSADRILRNAQAAAHRILTARRAEIEAAEAKLAGANTPTDRDVAQRKLTELLAPIDVIFERSLKGRLERIPTRSQRDWMNQHSRNGSKDGA